MPGRKYDANTTRVSLAADTSENVISYLTFLAVDNKDLSLRLGMFRSPWPILAPGISIALVAIAFNLLGDGLRDVLNPHSQE